MTQEEHGDQGAEGDVPGIDEALDAQDMERLFTRYVDARMEREEREYSDLATSPGYPSLLRAAFNHYADVAKFDAGELVQWKPMMRNRAFPLEAVPAIVIRYSDPPVAVDSDGDPLAEPLDLVVGIVDGKQVYRLMHVPSARFTSFVE